MNMESGRLVTFVLRNPHVSEDISRARNSSHSLEDVQRVIRKLTTQRFHVKQTTFLVMSAIGLTGWLFGHLLR